MDWSADNCGCGSAVRMVPSALGRRSQTVRAVFCHGAGRPGRGRRQSAVYRGGSAAFGGGRGLLPVLPAPGENPEAARAGPPGGEKRLAFRPGRKGDADRSVPLVLCRSRLRLTHFPLCGGLLPRRALPCGRLDNRVRGAVYWYKTGCVRKTEALA